MQAEIVHKAHLTFNVGITGHRDITDKAKQAVSEGIYKILQHIKDKVNHIHSEYSTIYNKEEPELRLITALAEGSDRIAAHVALNAALDYKIQCPLPMNRKDYMEDFKTQESKNKFEELLSQTSSVMELNFGRESIPTCYLNAGLLMLEHVDVLLAVWDGKEARGIGGTGDIVRRAEQQGIPIIWLNTTTLGKICYINMSAHYYEEWDVKLNEYIETVLVPTAEDSVTISEMLDTFHQEDLSMKKPVKLYTKMVKLLSLTNKKNVNNSSYTSVADDIKQCYDKGTSNYVSKYIDNYERADALAIHYADIYRSASFMRAILPFLATLALALGFYWNWSKVVTLGNIIGFFLQALFLATIIVVSNKNEKLKWHKKFIDYRILAELFRQITYISPIGYASRGIRGADSEISWYKWYYRNIIRSSGLPPIKLGRDNVRLYLSCVTNQFVNGQIDYHEDKINIFQRIVYRLNKTGFIFFSVGIFITIVRFLMYFLVKVGCIHEMYFGVKVPVFFNMLSLILPAIGAVMFAILAQCGFESLEQKHKTMKCHLEGLDNESNFIGNSYNEIASFILRIADTTINEVSDWRLFLKSKAIKKT